MNALCCRKDPFASRFEGRIGAGYELAIEANELEAVTLPELVERRIFLGNVPLVRVLTEGE